MQPAVWAENSLSEWELLRAVGFGDEAALHDLVEANPALLPLSGSPQLVVLGREVSLGTGYADLIAVEPTGRLVVIEVKLQYNPGSKGAIVSQALSYASVLHGMSFEGLESRVVNYLRRRRSDSIVDACSGFLSDVVSLPSRMEDSLRTGRFRVVLVLDAAPADLIRLVGYLDAVGSQLTIDLVQVTAYEVAGRRVLVPQRIEPERIEQQEAASVSPASGDFVVGPDLFDARMDELGGPIREQCMRLRAWAEELAQEGVARLESYRGPTFATLLVRLADEGVGPVTVYNDGKTVSLGLYRQVFERRSPMSLSAVEKAVAPRAVGKGTSVYEFTDSLFQALTCAYREAAGKPTDV